MLVLRAGERVVAGGPALVVLVVFEHREVDDPHRLPGAAVEVALLVAEPCAQRAKGIVDDLGLVGAEEDQVAGLCPGAVDDGFQGIFVEVLDDRALQAGLVQLRDVIDLDVGEAPGAVDADEAGVFVDLAARQAGAAGNAQRGDAAVVAVGDIGEDLEGDIPDRVGDFGEFERDAQVRLVGTETAHRLGVSDARERVGQVDADRILEDVADQLLDQAGDFVLGHERGLDIDLGEFGLAVGAQILVAEALDDLVVAVEAGDHQQLLEQLRRLRQGEEVSRVNARRHQVVAGALRRALGQHRRFDVDEAVVVEEAAEGARRLVAQHQVLLHLRPAQVDDAVGQADVLGEVFLVELERGRHRRVQDFDLVAEHLDLARGEVGVGRAGGARTHLAGDLQAELVADGFGDL